MRASALARRAAVAAPRPDAEPVTKAHKPSFDIRVSSGCNLNWVMDYHIARQDRCKIKKLRFAELNQERPACRHAGIGACQEGGFSPSWAARKCVCRQQRQPINRRGTPWPRAKTSSLRRPKKSLPISRTRK